MRMIRFKDKRPLVMLSPEKILQNPAQPRKEFEESSLSSLAQSLRENGMMQPITVQKQPEGYLLISGERRLRAALQIGMKKVPCMVVKASAQTVAVMTLLENLQREPLNFWEEARGIHELLSTWGLTREDAAARLGIACSALSEKLKVLSLTPWQQERIMGAGLTQRHAYAFLRLAGEEERNDCILKVIAGELTPSQTEIMVDRLLKEKETPPPKRKTLIGDLRLFANTIDHAVSTMNRSGLQATATKNETDRFVEYTVHIEKAGEDPAKDAV